MKAGGCEANRARQGAEHEPAEFSVPHAELGERRSTTDEEARAGGVEGHHDDPPAIEECADDSRHLDLRRDDDVGWTRGEDELRECVCKETWCGPLDATERTQLPGVDGDVMKGAIVMIEDEEPRITSRGMMIEHMQRVTFSRARRRRP